MRPILFAKEQRNIKAQGAVEFALILPVLLLLLLGLIETGRLIFNYSTVTNAAREATRYGSATGVNENGNYRFADCDEIINSAVKVGFLDTVRPENVRVTFDSGPGTAVLGGCPGSGSSTLPSSSSVQTGTRIVVEIDSPFDTFIPGLLPYQGMNIRAESSRTIIRAVNIASTEVADVAKSSPPTATKTPTTTLTPSETPTLTPLSSATSTATDGPSPTPSNTPTITLTFTPTSTSTPTNTPIPLVITWVNPVTTITHRNDTRFEVTAYDPNVCPNGLPADPSQKCNISRVEFYLKSPGDGVMRNWVRDSNRKYCLYGGDTTCEWFSDDHWNNRQVGTYVLKARAADNNGRYSDEIELSFSMPANLPVFVDIAVPGRGQVISLQSQTAFEAIAYDADLCSHSSCSGAGVQKVEAQILRLNLDGSWSVVFEAIGGSALTSAPYCLVKEKKEVCEPMNNNAWSALANGTYKIRARALGTDNVWTTPLIEIDFTVQK